MPSSTTLLCIPNVEKTHRFTWIEVRLPMATFVHKRWYFLAQYITEFKTQNNKHTTRWNIHYYCGRICLWAKNHATQINALKILNILNVWKHDTHTLAQSNKTIKFKRALIARLITLKYEFVVLFERWLTIMVPHATCFWLQLPSPSAQHQHWNTATHVTEVHENWLIVEYSVTSVVDHKFSLQITLAYIFFLEYECRMKWNALTEVKKKTVQFKGKVNFTHSLHDK